MEDNDTTAEQSLILTLFYGGVPIKFIAKLVQRPQNTIEQFLIDVGVVSGFSKSSESVSMLNWQPTTEALIKFEQAADRLLDDSPDNYRFHPVIFALLSTAYVLCQDMPDQHLYLNMTLEEVIRELEAPAH